ncbi:ATPase AAA [Glaciibacter superstes]|uniref:ATPase AAA n=1 Tax=Glaciibacter superstes TaxID=501023 RepID=UPI0003B3CEF0|nr:ATPase AAA [Glaciibacter superstes]
MLSSKDAIPLNPRRSLIAGVSGAGKSTLAARIAHELGVQYVELDALYHGPSWTKRETFEAEVESLVSTPGWVTEWQYHAVRDLLASRADTLVWLDLSFRIVLWRIVWRTVRRARQKSVLWNGNVEPGVWHALTQPEGIIRWAISTRRKYRVLVPAAAVSYPDLQVVRLRTQRQIDDWVGGPLRDVSGSTGEGRGASAAGH